MGAIALDCNACKAPTSMKATKVSRFNGVLRLIGWIIVIPSLIGVATSFLTCVATTNAAEAAIAASTTDAASAGAAVGAGISYGVSAFFGAASLASGLIGFLLLLTRKVFKCGQCGFILDRA